MDIVRLAKVVRLVPPRGFWIRAKHIGLPENLQAGSVEAAQRSIVYNYQISLI